MENIKKEINRDECWDECSVSRFYRLIGKKWAHPLLLKFESNKSYSFEEIVTITSRRINRTSLSTILKGMISLDLIEKQDSKYMISEKGEKIKLVLIKTKNLLLDNNKTCAIEWKENCEIAENFNF